MLELRPEAGPAAASLRLPYPPYLRKVVRSSAGLWILVRIAYVVVLIIAAFSGLLPLDEAIALVLHPLGMIRALLVAFAGVLVWGDRSRAHELLLPANLGAWPGWFWAASLLTGLVLDVAVQAVLAAF